ncbi:MAG TPA: hypothetical protein VM598_00175, partial [Bdellovibrionota bacterium]|nr:hypothetical protein [Bdellovibrionota bacterium]
REIVESALYPGDYHYISNLSRDRYGLLLRDFCLLQDREVITNLAHRPEVKSFDLAALCLADPSVAASPEFRSFLVSVIGYEKQFAALYASLSAKSASVKSRRLVANAELARISPTGPAVGRGAIRPVSELMPPRIESWDQLPTDLRALVEGLAVLLAEGHLERAKRLTSGDSRFYGAFGIASLLSQIRDLPVPVALDRATAVDAVQTMFTTYWQTAVVVLRQRLGDGADAKIRPWLESIESSRLGYEIGN